MLAKDAVEINFVINAALWLLEHMNDEPKQNMNQVIMAEEVPKNGIQAKE